MSFSCRFTNNKKKNILLFTKIYSLCVVTVLTMRETIKYRYKSNFSGADFTSCYLLTL